MSNDYPTFDEVWEQLKAEDKTGVYERAEALSFITTEALEYAYNNGYRAAKEEIISEIARHYSEHGELVPDWLSIGNMKRNK